MQWNNIRADFSDSNQLAGIAANQVNQGVTTATDTLTTTAELFRQAEQDKLAELERRHKMLIADKTLELENEKLAETERLNTSAINVNDANIGKIAMENKLTGVKVDKTNAEITNDKNKTIAEIKEKEALAKYYKAQAGKTSTSTSIAKEEWGLKKGLLEEKRKAIVLNEELKKQKQQYDELKSDGSPAFILKIVDGKLTKIDLKDKVWFNGGMIDKDVYKTEVNLNNTKKIAKTNEDAFEIISKDIGIDPKTIDKVVNHNNDFFNKGLGDNYYINSKAYKDVIGTLTSKFKGNIQNIKRMVNNGLVYDPNTGGVGVPKEYVNTKGNFVSTAHRNAFLVESYVKANGSNLKDSTKYMHINNGLNALGIKNTRERKLILDILNKRSGE